MNYLMLLPNLVTGGTDHNLLLVPNLVLGVTKQSVSLVPRLPLAWQHKVFHAHAGGSMGMSYFFLTQCREYSTTRTCTEGFAGTGLTVKS